MSMFAQRLLVGIAICLYTAFASIPEPSQYILSFPTQDNPMNVTVVSPPEKNYILVIGDWGSQGDKTDNALQKVVSEKMLSFYNQSKANGMNLLMVITVGDNFYYRGQTCSGWSWQWTAYYGEIATNYPWLAVMGNHDWGYSDPNALCAWGTPNPYIEKSTGMAYNGHQLNKDKRGCNPDNYYLPDYGYYYTINELNFELIQLEENIEMCGGGDFPTNYSYCNSATQTNSKNVACPWMAKMVNASERMMEQRAKESTATNVLIGQHYPNNGERLVDTFKKVRGKYNASIDRFWSIFGHEHDQKCFRTNPDTKNCDAILSGGGGGCCQTDGHYRGFYVIGFDENKRMTQPYKINDPLISCVMPCGVSIDVEDIIENKFINCCDMSHYSIYSETCRFFDLSKC